MEHSFRTILLERTEGVAVLTLNQPDKRNLMTEQMFTELLSALRIVAEDESIRVFVLTAAGDIFCGGVDLREHFLQPLEKARKGELNMALDRSFSEVGIPALLLIKKPTIAAVNGAAVGLGFTLCLPFDLRIASEKARIILPFLRVGIAPEFGSTYYLTRLIGVSRALDLLYTGRSVGAEEALGMGLVNRVVPAERLLEETLRLAASIAKGPPIATRFTRDLIYHGSRSDLESALHTEHFAYNVCRQTEDHEEAVKSFFEKREPRFHGK
jgi:2-(1,2-epoxy-1,2-dihydrophenyl)acetyl-CoA isomerase